MNNNIFVLTIDEWDCKAFPRKSFFIHIENNKMENIMM